MNKLKKPVHITCENECKLYDQWHAYHEQEMTELKSNIAKMIESAIKQSHEETKWDIGKELKLTCKDMPAEYGEIINRRFWDLIG